MPTFSAIAVSVSPCSVWRRSKITRSSVSIPPSLTEWLLTDVFNRHERKIYDGTDTDIPDVRSRDVALASLCCPVPSLRDRLVRDGQKDPIGCQSHADPRDTAVVVVIQRAGVYLVR